MNDKDLDELLKNSAPCSYCGISGLHVCDGLDEEKTARETQAKYDYNQKLLQEAREFKILIAVIENMSDYYLCSDSISCSIGTITKSIINEMK